LVHSGTVVWGHFGIVALEPGCIVVLAPALQHFDIVGVVRSGIVDAEHFDTVVVECFDIVVWVRFGIPRDILAVQLHIPRELIVLHNQIEQEQQHHIQPVYHIPVYKLVRSRLSIVVH
jgi:hypothetical protein